MGHLKSNYHTHNRLCNHAVGDIKDYVEKAINLGMDELGLSDHGPVLARFMSKELFLETLSYRNMSLDVFYNVYLPQLEEAKNKYKDKIKIYKGLEIEYIEGEEPFYKELLSHLDYMNLGLHFFKDKNGNIINSYWNINHKNILDYADVAIKGMSTGLFKTLVHPDLFMFGYKNKYGKRVFDEVCEEASKRIIEAAIKYDCYLEVNVNGLKNSKKYDSIEWLYPSYEFWCIASTYKDLKIVIGVDAHNPEDLDSSDIDLVKEFCKKLNLNVLEYITF